MKIENKPSACGFLAGLLVLLLAVVANTSCAHASKMTSRGVHAQYDAAVKITARCLTPEGNTIGWYGSGVIVSPTRIFTAAHVADTEGGLCAFQVETLDGELRMAQPAHVDPSVDLASMTLLEGEKPFEIWGASFAGLPTIGDTVCAAPAFPSRMHKCGEVQPYAPFPGDITFLVVVEPGNSGAGVYDAGGRLVGIVTHLTMCRNRQVCGGKAASLKGHLDELLGRPA